MAQSLDGLTDFRSPAPTPPLDVWKRPEDGLPDDDSNVLAAIWWEDAANPEESTYSIHDCAYYEGGEGSGQKIFTDCEGEEFEAKEVAFWIYKKDLAASLLRRHIASPAPQSWPHKAGGIIDAWDGLSNDCASDPDLETLGRLINEMRKEIEESGPASPAQPEKPPKCWKCAANLPHEWQFCEPLPAPPQSGKQNGGNNGTTE